MNIILLRKEELSEGCFSFSKTDERFLHIKKVLKLGVGSTFKAGIIDGEKGTAEIISFSDELLTARFSASAEQAPDNGDCPSSALPHIRLILGFPRPIQLRRILRDVAGLGIEALYLTGTELGEKSYLQADIAAEEEIERLLIDGCSQAGETHIPKVYRAYSLRYFSIDIRMRYGRSICGLCSMFLFKLSKIKLTKLTLNESPLNKTALCTVKTAICIPLRFIRCLSCSGTGQKRFGLP